MENPSNHAPCTDKNCGFCCDPVKINKRRIINVRPILFIRKF